MSRVTRVVLDVLKPHQPDALQFARAIAACGEDYRVRLTVIEVDEKTETLQVVVEAQRIDMERIHGVIEELGAALHSIDEVEVQGKATD